MPEHPMQPLEKDKHGTVRFKKNAVVRFLLEAGPFDLNQIWQMPWSIEDMEQFYQLIGYSVSGFGEISGFRKETVAEADRRADHEFYSKDKQ